MSEAKYMSLCVLNSEVSHLEKDGFSLARAGPSSSFRSRCRSRLLEFEITRISEHEENLTHEDSETCSIPRARTRHVPECMRRNGLQPLLSLHPSVLPSFTCNGTIDRIGGARVQPLVDSSFASVD